jgi:hypothetical protein
MSSVIWRPRIRISLCLLSVLVAMGCSRLFDERTVRRDFLKEHPDYTVVSVGEPDGHGGSSAVTFFIRYKKPGDTREFWSDWAYENEEWQA